MPDVLLTLGMVLACVVAVLVGMVALAGMVALTWAALHSWILLPLACRRVVLGLVYIHRGYGLVRVDEIRDVEVRVIALDDRARRRIEAGDAVRFLREARPATGAEQLGVLR